MWGGSAGEPILCSRKLHCLDLAGGGLEGVEFLPLFASLCHALQPSFTTSEAGTSIDSCDSFSFGPKPSGGRDVIGKKLGDLNGTRKLDKERQERERVSERERDELW